MITTAILSVREHYVQSMQAESLIAINAGLCEDFAKDVMIKLGGMNTSVVHDVCVASFLTVSEDCEFEDGRPFDRDLLRQYWPNVVPTQGLSWDELDALSEAAGFGCGTHVWLTDSVLHYDAECPAGTENFLDLPFFQRVIGAWRKVA